MPQQPWIDFRALREQLNFSELLRHYDVELKRKGKDQLTGFCPLPGHQGEKKSPSFSVNLDRKIWQCFGCHRGGNALDFVIVMEGRNPKDNRDVRAVAVLLMERYGPAAGNKPDPRPDRPPREAKAATPPNPPSRAPEPEDRQAHENAERGATRPAVLVNAPLDFELKGLDPKHPYLRERGFSDATIMHFGLGFCNRGLMQGRVVIPLRDDAGNLIGYAGRFTRDDHVNEKVPKYLFPGDRERRGTKLEFRKSLFLYNGHAIREPVRDLYVVEGFAGTWWLHQAGFHDTVAVMGSSCSVEQKDLILRLVSPSGRVWLIPDGDKAGDRCAAEMLELIAPHRFCRWVRLREGQPTDLSPDELVRLLEWKVVP